jgi:hypothetical protein
MNTNKSVRVIKRGERREAVEAPAAVAAEKVAALREREMKTVVSGWVSEHRQRTEEFRQTFAALFRGMDAASLGGAA